jgi:hypothetical protein
MSDAADVASPLETFAGAAIATLRRKPEARGIRWAAIDGAGRRMANICGRTLNCAAAAGELRIVATCSDVARVA